MTQPQNRQGPIATAVVSEDHHRQHVAYTAGRKVRYEFLAAQKDENAEGGKAGDRVVTDSASRLSTLPYVVTAAGDKNRVLCTTLSGKSFARLGVPFNTPEVRVPDDVTAVEIYLGNDAFAARRFTPLFRVELNDTGLTRVVTCAYAFLFDAEHETLDYFFGPPCTKRVISAMECLQCGALRTQIYKGSLLPSMECYRTSSIAVTKKEDGRAISVNRKPDYGLYGLVVCELGDSLSELPNSLDRDSLLGALARKEIWTIVLSSITPEQANLIDDQLIELDPNRDLRGGPRNEGWEVGCNTISTVAVYKSESNSSQHIRFSTAIWTGKDACLGYTKLYFLDGTKVLNNYLCDAH